MNNTIGSTILYLCLWFGLLTNCSKDDGNVNGATTQPTVLFVKTLGGSLNDSGQSIIKTSDGGYAILGHTQSNDGDIQNKTNTSFDYWLLKFNGNHQIQWQKSHGGSDDDKGTDIIQTSDGGYAIFGQSQSNDGDVSENGGADDFWILKLDASGNIIWEKSFGFLGADTGTSILQTNDNGFLLVGVLDVTASNGQGNSKFTAIKHAGGDYWVIKLDSNGEKQWSKFYGGTFTDTPYDAIQTADNGYIIVGSSDSEDVDISGNKGSYDFWVIKISETGTLLWEKSFGGTRIDEAWGIESTEDGNYLVVGDTRSNDEDVSNNNGGADIFLIKISPDGDLIWEKTFGGNSFDVGRSISKTIDGGYLLSGSSRSSDGDASKNNGQNDAWIIKLNSNAEIEWQKTIGGSNIDFGFDAVELNDGSVIVAGESSSSDADIDDNKGFSDLLLFNIKP
ncbi:hypothetical protein H7U19_07615 [Hyunsoonleella sp. SJ7]|uniref:Bulb-type lectin domain-containing protein n=1 Tax=Hyunsoonleella aquatilis TaxID=2762758 RepID=A0A923H7R0_9FLAO|nr:hypothetical protein [Hyunsoonleella aquatilis]MBC3758266.1 hypothetical protein [Hyunsoonleella aquatilis]